MYNLNSNVLFRSRPHTIPSRLHHLTRPSTQDLHTLFHDALGHTTLPYPCILDGGAHGVDQYLKERTERVPTRLSHQINKQSKSAILTKRLGGPL